MEKETILLIRASKRRDNVDSLQKVLTEYGCIIKTRLGLHEAGSVCSDEGLIILQLTGEAEETEKFERSLKELDGIVFQAVQI